MRAFLAMLVDAYRDLNSKKLFWVTLTISMIVVVFYGSIGFDEDGMSMFYGLWSIDSVWFTHGSPLSNILYRSIFSSFMVGIWLTWVAIILALISTAAIFPDFMSPGAIDVVLAKPIGRLRLFIYKYITSLLFVFVQVAIFCAGVFLCLGVRLGDWDWRVFLGVPVVLAFFSYLFAISVLVGTWTRSALTALLVTMLAWASLFAVNATEFIIDVNLKSSEVRIEQMQRFQDRDEQALARIPDTPETSNRRKMLTEQLEEQRAPLDEAVRGVARARRIQGFARTVQRILPKTSETAELLNRWLVRETDIDVMDLLGGQIRQTADGQWISTDNSDDRKVRQRQMEELRSRSLWYVIGTSLLFELLVLSGAAWKFCRRDY